ncbi:DUF4178 [Desulfonema limicola]|uniref:DUF4178 n=1 Tax=Desulfonema limicola TaxID=45656 RepID=A0A975B7C2_9BACT|nr:DUF4178 domain-containing protein [Desulfonema limicola]QTA80239.1 DUF4178 [Desulfonema limicola]
MGWKDFFGFGKKDKEADKETDNITNISLSSIKPGYFLDYDLKTWEVTARHHYDWGDSDLSYEWQLKSHDETIYLSRESDDQVDWTVARPISFLKLGSHIRKHIEEHEDPPDEIEFESIKYYLAESGGGHFFKDGTGPGQAFISWDYEDESGKKYLSIEQWGEDEFEASAGQLVEEYQFTNILPGKNTA